MLQIILPLSFIPSTILMDINSVAVGLVVEPFPFEHIAIHVPELAVSACFIESPISLVLGSVFPDLDAVAMLQVSEPLADVCCAIFEMDFWSLFQLGLVYLAHIELAVELSI